MFENALEPKTKLGLKEIQKFSWLNHFYLAGGTSIALYFGHRMSQDLDFFTLNQFNPASIRADLQTVAPFTTTDQKEDTLSGVWQGVKLSFMRYPYKLIEEKALFLNVAIASLEDVALMKCDAIASRGTKRDFIDLYWIAKHSDKSLVDLVRLTKKKFGANYSTEHLIKSLLYFQDAESEPMPKMLKKVSWEEVKLYFTHQTMTMARKFIFDL